MMKMNRFQIRSGAMVGILTIALGFALSQTYLFAAVTGQKITGKELIGEFDGGQLYKVRYADGTMEDVVIDDNGKMASFDPDEHVALPKKTKISAALQKKLDKGAATDGFLVTVWLTDLDYGAIDKEVKADLGIEDIRKIDARTLQSYITAKRAITQKKYTQQLQDFQDNYLDSAVSGKVVWLSKYAPLLIAKLTKETVKKIETVADVIAMDLFVNAKKVDETAYSIPNINANYTKNLGYTGSGVTVGIVESGYCDKTNFQLSDRDISFDVTDSQARRRLSTHATVVTSIVVGNTQGIVPAATVYVVQALNRLQDYEKIEWLLDRGVTVINYSAGYTDVQGTYSDMAKWIDHLGNQHNVHFVKSAGNYTSSYLITDPGMAYNAITVGSIYDHNSTAEPDWTDDALSAFSRYSESDSGYKPDLTAPGQGIDIAGYTNKSGTSFAAPHVTAVLTQLLDYNSNLILNTALLKAVCAAGTIHRTATDYGGYSLSPAYSNQEGAGVIDSQGAYMIAAHSGYADLELTAAQFPYYISFNVSQTTNPVRVALAWLKQNTIGVSSRIQAREAITERLLSDLDLTVYNPNNVAVASSVSGANNLELVQFTPSVAGSYRIKVSAYTLRNSSEKVGVAWYQAN
jgi:serine protease AprX